MGFNLGSTAVSSVKLGTTSVNKIYLGSTQVYPNSTPPTPSGPDYGEVVIFDYSIETTELSNVSGGTVSVTDDAALAEMFSEGALGFEPTFPVSITVTMDDPDPGMWMIDCQDDNSEVIWLDGYQLSECMELTPSSNYPTEMSFLIDSIGGVIIDETQTTTRTLEDAVEFESLVPTDGFVLTDVPIQALSEVVVGNQITSLPDDFLSGIPNLSIIDFEFASSLTTIGDNVLYNCKSFSSIVLLPSSLRTIGDNFLAQCDSFGATVTLPSGLQSIGDGFLSYSFMFDQPITVPSSVSSVGSRFLGNCESFNSTLTMDSGTSVGSLFLQSCVSFNQPISLYTDGYGSIPSNYMTQCQSFNQPITFPAGLTGIGQQFLAGCRAFNQPITLPNTLTTIGSGFLSYCVIFNRPISVPSGVTVIDELFLSGCQALNSTVTLPSNLTQIKNNFMESCSLFNQPITFPSSLTSIGSYFLSYSIAYNQPITLPEGLLTIGANFLYNASAYNSDITLPSTLTRIDSQFLGNVRDMTGYVDFGALATSIMPSNYSVLSAQNSNSAAYTTGISIKGSNRAAWLAYMPNKNSFPFRKLIDYGS